MKLIDKHILRQFLVPLGYCLLAFTMIFVIADLFQNLSTFIEAQTSVFQILRYFVYLLPAMTIYIAPISILLGILYSLWQLTKHNELIAMRASGINFYRIIMPFLAVGLLFSVGVSIIQEKIAPWSSYWAQEFIKAQDNNEDASTRYATNLPFKNHTEKRSWVIGRLDLRTHNMENVRISKDLPDGSKEIISAKEAKYHDGRWWFYDIETQKFDINNAPVGLVRKEHIWEMEELSETPRHFINMIKDPFFFSAAELREFINIHGELEEKQRNNKLVDMHARMAMPWTCIIVVLFGIPCGVYSGRRGPFIGIMLSFLTFFGFYFIMMLFQWMGKTQMLAPLLSAWMPNMMFFLIGAWLMYRAR